MILAPLICRATHSAGRFVRPFRLGLALATSVVVARAADDPWFVDESFAPTLYHEDDVARALRATSDGNDGYYVIGGHNRARHLTSADAPTDPFTHIDGAPAEGVIHLHADGSIDSAFRLELPPEAHAAGLPVVTAGRSGFWLRLYENVPYSRVNLASRSWTIRHFHDDGSLDETTATIDLGAINPQIAPRHDGGLVIWGDFTEVSGEPRRELAIIAPDGSLTAFTVPWELNAFWINSVAATPSGHLLVSGTRVLPRTTRYEILKLDSSGTIDDVFTANTAASAQGSHHISAVLPDGRFHTTQTRAYRFWTDGTIDPSWQPVWSVGTYVEEIHPQSDGRVLLSTRSGTELRAVDGTLITTLEQVPGVLDDGDLLAVDSADSALVLHGHIASLPHSGFEMFGFPVDRFVDARLARWSLTSATLIDLPHTFAARRETIVDQLQIDQTGRILVGGNFTTFDGHPRPGMARLKSNGDLDRAFAPTADLRPILPLRDGSWIAHKLGYELFDGQSVPTATLRPVHVRADGSLNPNFNPPAIAQDAANNFSYSSARWWGQRATGDVLMSAPGLDPAKPYEITFAWIDPNTSAIRSLLPFTFPQLSAAESIPPISNIDPVAVARCTPAGRVIIVSFDDLFNLWTMRENPRFTYVDANGVVDTARAALLAPFDLVGDNLPAVNDAGDLLLTVNDPTNPLSGRKHLVIDEHDQIQVWDDEPIFLPIPMAVDTHGWLGARLLADARGNLDGDFHTDPRFSPGLRDGNSNDIGHYIGGARDAFGRLWLGGRFDTVDGRARPGLVRLLNFDGATRLTNISARSEVSATTPQIVGFVLAGDNPQEILIRAIGEGLRPYWPDASDAAPLLVSPLLSLHLADGTTSPLVPSPAIDPAIVAVANRVGAFPLPQISDDRFNSYAYGVALDPMLSPAPHTAVVRSGDGTTGVALLEVYDAAETMTGSVLHNLSLRSVVGTGDRSMMAGFVVQGHRAAKLLLRGIGPGLVEYGVGSAVDDPRITLFNGNEIVAASDDWIANTDMNFATVASGAFTLTAGSKDAAILIELPPGTYTLKLDAEEAATGEALLEIYHLDPSS